MNITHESADMSRQIDDLCAAVFGPGWRARTAQRLRDGNRPWHKASRVAIDVTGEVVAAARIWPVAVGRTRGVVLLGPVVVAAHRRGQGFGLRLASEALEAARDHGARWAVLVGDLSYFGQIDFVRSRDDLQLPGPVADGRLLIRPLCAQRNTLSGLVSVPRAARQASSTPEP